MIYALFMVLTLLTFAVAWYRHPLQLPLFLLTIALVLLHLFHAQLRFRRPGRHASPRFNWISGLLPRLEASEQRPHILPSGVEKRLRHTGAGMLVRSRAIRDDQIVVRNLRQMRVDLVGRHADRSWNLRIGSFPRIRRARIEHGGARSAGSR